MLLRTILKNRYDFLKLFVVIKNKKNTEKTFNFSFIFFKKGEQIKH